MFKTKKDVDRHVRAHLAKLHSENEKNQRGFVFAKLYYKIQEYATAQHYVSTYLTVNEECAPAHKLLGQCLLQLKKPDKALEAFQRSLNIDPKQPELLVEVCKMLLSDENTMSVNKAKYWCDLAESENVQHNAVFSLRLKLLNKSNLESTQIEELILKEISSRPTDPNLRVRIVKHFLEQNKVVDAFKYAFDLEMNNRALFANCIDWYNIISVVLSKYKQLPNSKKSWDFWLLSMTCIEKQVDLSFANTSSNQFSNGATTDIANLLFTFDQHLFESGIYVLESSPEKELGAQFLCHFRGQLCLHAAALIFRREQVQNKNQWREALKNALPVLMFAFQADPPDMKESWLRHSGEKTRQLIQMWYRDGAFRCVQAGRTILSCIDNSKEETLSSQVHNLISDQGLWASADDILSQLRQYCSDNTWRMKLFRILFPNSDQLVKIQTSYLVSNVDLVEPEYELPRRSEIETYEEIAQYLRPHSLQHMVYLCIGVDNLCDIRCKYFNGLNFSTKNLAFCGAESLSRLDMETFLCAAKIQAKRSHEVERVQYESYNAKNVSKPTILPYANMANLCTESQANWWQAAHQVYKNLAGENLSEIRATLQFGIEAVRGINGPKMDMIIILKLAKIFLTRAQDATKSIERGFLEDRALHLFKYGLTMMKLHNKGALEPFRKFFKYNNSNSASVEREINSLAEEAVVMIATRYFKSGDYEDCIEELSGIQLPYATYFQAEAYRKLDESNKTPKKTKRFYSDKAKDCLDQTLQLLSFSNDKNHPLKSIVQTEIKKVQYTDVFGNDDHLNNIESREEFLNESFNASRSQRDLQSSISAAKTVEMENLLKQMMNTLSFVKEELVERIKPEVSEIKKDLAMLKEKVSTIEENMKKKSEPPSRDDAAKDFDDLYIIGEDLQPVMLSQFNQQQNQQQVSAAPQRMHTPNAMLNQQTSNMVTNAPMHAASNIYNSPLYNPLLNQQPHPGHYNAAGGASANVYNMPPYNANYPFNYYSQIMMPGMMGMGLQSQQQQQAPVLSQAECNPSLYELLNAPSNPQVMNPTIGKPVADKPVTQAGGVTDIWNRVFNNAPVEKGPPVNVVITSSDPLPTQTTVSTQSTLSVTIPPHHIKPSIVPNDFGGISQLQTNTSFPIITSNLPFTSTSAALTTGANTTSTISSTISFAPPKTSAVGDSIASLLNKSNESNSSDIHNKSAEIEYEPQVEFQPVIPLPDEIEVRTGEENEDILFCSRAKLLRLVEKEWKERGIGDIKILKSKIDGKIRILMRREQTHKMCANHYLTPEIKLIQAKDEKSFIWCADDFADEQVKREKLCVRFKQVEAGKEFQKAFLQAQEELKGKQVIAVDTKNPVNSDKPQDKVDTSTVVGLSKAPVFNFGKVNTSTPKTVAKTVPPAPKFGESTTAATTVSAAASGNTTFSKLVFGPTVSETLPKDKNVTETSKPSPFSNFSFASTTSAPKTDSPFASIFSKTTLQTNVETKSPFVSAAPVASDSSALNKDAANKSTASDADVEDEYVPTAQFQPVIPLPDLVEVQTGEENEKVLFEHRAKLLRFDKSTGEWKERGVGVMKLLVHRDDVNHVRLVMRREQVLKLCCNQRLMKDTQFKYVQKSMNALTWVGQDFSENELQTEILAVRFKTAELCKEFLETIKMAQEQMSEDVVADKGSTSAPSGLEMSKKADTVEPFKAKDSKADQESSLAKQHMIGFGDKFKPKPGSWSCNQCYISNKADTLYCVACESPKDDTVPKKTSFGPYNGTAPTKTTFTFGFGAANANPAPEPVKPITSGFGDQFKPKAGSWTCQACYLSNDATTQYCGACEAPKDNTVPKKEQSKNAFAPSSTAPKFQFGFLPATDSSKNVSTAAGVASDSTGVSSTTTAMDPAPNAKPFDFGKRSSGFIFGSSSNTMSNNIFSAATDSNAPPFTFSPSTMFGVANDQPKGETVVANPNLDVSQKPTANGNAKSGADFKLEKQEFTFMLKPKSPGKAKSPARNVSIGDEEGSEEEYIEEEENNTYFAPVIPLPDKVDVVTGEENEEELYCHRAKLYRFTSGEWKERGVGDVKILRHKETRKLRVVMRREKIHKICLNHALTPSIEYKPKDEKSWSFAANDFSEGEFQSTVFLIRFKNKEIGEGFIDAIRKALADNDEGSESKSVHKTVSDLPEDLRKLADQLKLPYEFYQYDESNQCSGCRGCDPDNFVFPNYGDKNELVDEITPIPLSMPQMQTTNKSILRQSMLAAPTLTPRKDTGSDAEKKGSEAVNIFSGSNSLDKFTKSLSGAGSAAENKFTFRIDETKAAQDPADSKFTSGGFLFGSSITSFSNSADRAKPIFGQSVFSNSNTTPAPIFGSATTTLTFGGTNNNVAPSTGSIFGGTNNSTASSTGTIFGGQSTTTTSQIIQSTSEPQNIFSSLSLRAKEDQAKPIFGSKPTFTFGTTSFAPTFGSNNLVTKDNNAAAVDVNTAFLASESQVLSNNKENDPKSDSVSAQPMFKNDPGISFAALAANANTQGSFKTAPEGQSISGFVGLKQTGDFSIFLTSANESANKANVSNTSQEGGAGAEDSTYDPHYEPIIELPELITVTTGEENEEKLFGERGVLYRYDTTNKEWKERGTGEMKILYHPEKKTYRLLMRREQIHKLVLNHAIGADFQLKPMHTSGKSFCWGAMNYAENPPQAERLAIRFKNAELAMKFENEVLKCVENTKNGSADLEPEED